MLIYTLSRNANATSERCAERVKAIIDSYAEETIESAGKAKWFVVKHSWRWDDFILMALKYGMLIQIKKGGGKNNPSIFMKTHNYPTFKVEERPKTKKEYQPRKPKLGDGSVLKPNFNHAISKPDDSKLEIYRTQRPKTSKLPIIGKLEDIGAYDVQSKLERLRMMQR